MAKKKINDDKVTLKDKVVDVLQEADDMIRGLVDDIGEYADDEVFPQTQNYAELTLKKIQKVLKEIKTEEL